MGGGGKTAKGSHRHDLRMAIRMYKTAISFEDDTLNVQVEEGWS